MYAYWWILQLQRYLPLSDLPHSLLSTRFRHIATVIEQERKHGYKIPYDIEQLQQAKALLAVSNRYSNILADPANPKRFYLHSSEHNYRRYIETCDSRLLRSRHRYPTSHGTIELTLKVYYDDEGRQISFEYLTLDTEIADSIKAKRILKKGSQVSRQNLKDYHISVASDDDTVTSRPVPLCLTEADPFHKLTLSRAHRTRPLRLCARNWNGSHVLGSCWRNRCKMFSPEEQTSLQSLQTDGESHGIWEQSWFIDMKIMLSCLRVREGTRKTKEGIEVSQIHQNVCGHNCHSSGKEKFDVSTPVDIWNPSLQVSLFLLLQRNQTYLYHYYRP